VRNLDSDDRNRKLQLSRGENQYSIVHKPLRPQGRGMNSKYFFPPNVSCLPQVIQLECNCINHNNIAKSVVLLFLCLYKFCLQASLHIVIQSISCPAMTLHPSANYCEINSVCPWIYKGRNGCLQQLTLGHMPSHFTTIFLEFPPTLPKISISRVNLTSLQVCVSVNCKVRERRTKADNWFCLPWVHWDERHWESGQILQIQ
jgi:hypothetical protein